MSEREAEMIAGSGQARVDHVADAVADRSVENGAVASDDLVVLGVPRRDENQRRYACEVEACGVIEVEARLPVARRATTAHSRHLALGQSLERQRGELPVCAGHHDHDGCVSYRGSLQ